MQSEKVSQKQMLLLIAGGVALVAIIGIVLFFLRHTTIDKEAARNAFESAECAERIRGLSSQDPLYALIHDNDVQVVPGIESIDETLYEPVPEFVSFTLKGTPIFWRLSDHATDPDTHPKIVVRGDVFSDISPTSVNTPINNQLLTRFVYDFFQPLSERDIIFLLIQTHMIETVDDLSADVCLSNEEKNDDAYVAHFTSVHESCVRGCRSDLSDFTVTIDRSTNNIYLNTN